MTSACQYCRGRLPSFVGEELSAAELNAVRAHLRDCLACRNEASSFLRARNALQATGAATASGPAEPFFAQMHADILASVAVEPAPAPAVGWPGSRWSVARWRGVRWAIAAAAVLALTVAVWPVRNGLLDRRAIPSAGIVVSPYAGPGAQPMQPLGFEGPGESRNQGMRGRAELHGIVDRDEPRSPVRAMPVGISGTHAAQAGILTGQRRAR
ncbi:MAG: zf-HC2 domain-containing protein [Planctomycetes bacterium]|nr:zf-HC2 domain-containing protein [Planctomycetota bacterium]